LPDFLSRNNLSGSLHQHPKDLERLFAEEDPAVGLVYSNWAQFARLQVEFKRSEPDAVLRY